MNWKDELKENMTTAGELKDFLNLTDEETVQMDKILEQFPMTVTRYYLSLINRDDPKDPIRRMCIPTISENDLSGTSTPAVRKATPLRRVCSTNTLIQP